MPKKVKITIEEFRNATAVAFSLVLAKRKIASEKEEEIIDISTDAMIYAEDILFNGQDYNLDRILREILHEKEHRQVN